GKGGSSRKSDGFDRERDSGWDARAFAQQSPAGAGIADTCRDLAAKFRFDYLASAKRTTAPRSTAYRSGTDTTQSGGKRHFAKASCPEASKHRSCGARGEAKTARAGASPGRAPTKDAGAAWQKAEPP